MVEPAIYEIERPQHNRQRWKVNARDEDQHVQWTTGNYDVRTDEASRICQVVKTPSVYHRRNEEGVNFRQNKG